MADEDLIAVTKPTRREITDVLTVLANLGIAVKAVRIARGLSLREVAKQTGLSASTVMRIEGGEDTVVTHATILLVWLGATTTEEPT